MKRTAIAAAVLTLALALPARAQSRDAAAFFEEAASAYARGDFRAAALAFEEANRRVKSGATLYNAAMAWEQARAYPQAADDFEAALDDAKLDAKNVQDARSHLTALEARVGRIDITADDSVTLTIAHVVKGRAPLRVHVLPGTYELRADYPTGRSVKLTTEVQARGLATLAVPREEPITAPPRVPTRAAAEAPPTAAAPAPAPSAPLARTLGFVSLGVAGASAASASAFGLVALGARDQFEQSGSTDRDAHDRAYGFRTAANVAWITTAVFAVTGTVLLLAAPRRER